MSIMESKVVFIGAGNMAEAIVGGMVSAEFCEPEKIVLTDIRPERRRIWNLSWESAHQLITAWLKTPRLLCWQ